MKRTTITAVLLVLYSAVAMAVTFPAKVTVNEAAKKQPAVTFDHARHATLAKTCETCHHTQKGLTKEAKIEVVKCSKCHLDPKDAKVPSMREMNLAKNPFHIKCLACHKADKKGPTACTGCHVKK